MLKAVDTGLTTNAPLSMALRAGDFVYISGQVPADLATGQLVTGTVEEQTKVVMERLQFILDKAGLSMADVVRTTVFLPNIEDFAAMNSVYRQYFSEPFPTRSTVEAKLAVDVAVEIDAIAYAGPEKG